MTAVAVRWRQGGHLSERPATTRSGALALPMGYPKGRQAKRMSRIISVLVARGWLKSP